MKKNQMKANASQAGAKAQQGQSGVVGSENTNIKVELTEKDNSSAIVNDGLANRIAKSFKKELDYLIEGDFNLTSPDEIRHFVNAVGDYNVKARGFDNYLHDLTHLCSSLGINIIVTLNVPCCGIKQVFIFSFEYKIISESCYDQLEGFVFTDDTYPFACSEESNLYKIDNKMFRSIPIDDFADIIYEALVIDKEPVKLAEWIMEFKSKF
jgi:hypothetical protein